MELRGEVVLALVLLWLSAPLEAQKQSLQYGFYSNACPYAEYIVRDVVNNELNYDSGLAAGLVRLHFHDCFVRGCDGSVLLDSTATSTAEKDSPPNSPSLRGFEVIDMAKTRLEAACQGVVSCADIVAFAARDSVVWSGGYQYQVPGGRRDGRVSLATDALSNLPPPTFNLTQLTDRFAEKGLTQEEMVTLSGAHSIGRTHCRAINDRLYNFNSTTAQDPAMDPTFASTLKQQCPEGGNESTVLPMDPRSPDSLDTSYYRSVLMNQALFPSDLVLLSDSATAMQVRMHAFNGYEYWGSRFVQAMVNMGQIDVLTGSDGEIRLNCRVVN